jgi:hypothetical protein
VEQKKGQPFWRQIEDNEENEAILAAEEEE